VEKNHKNVENGILFGNDAIILVKHFLWPTGCRAVINEIKNLAESIYFYVRWFRLSLNNQTTMQKIAVRGMVIFFSFFIQTRTPMQPKIFPSRYNGIQKFMNIEKLKLCHINNSWIQLGACYIDISIVIVNMPRRLLKLDNGN
jgi:hypothetical protein